MIWATKRNSARSCRKIPAVAKSVVMRKTALCIALRRVTISAALRIATPAKKKKMTLSSINVPGDRFLRHCNCGRGSRFSLFVQMQEEERCTKRHQRRDDKSEPAIPAIFRFENHSDSHPEDVDNPEWDKNVPPQAHELVKAIAWKRESQPHEEINVRADLQEKPERAVQSPHKEAPTEWPHERRSQN